MRELGENTGGRIAARGDEAIQITAPSNSQSETNSRVASHSSLLHCLTGALSAAVLFTLLTWQHQFTFMADDYVHLVRTHTLPDVFRDHFSSWLARLPVWSVTAWALFASRVLERTWAPVQGFFLVHCLGVALTSAAMLRTHVRPAESIPPVAIAAATFFACFFVNAAEVLYWPTCMPYTLGALFLGLGAYVRQRAARVVFLSASFMTYETFILPALALLFAETFPIDKAYRKRVISRLSLWLVAVGILLACRAIAGLYVGVFHHGINFYLRNVAKHMGESFTLLFRLKQNGLHTSQIATAGAVALLVTGIFACRPARCRYFVALLVGCYLSTAVYWVLAYHAERAIYGAQVLLCAILVLAASQIFAQGGRAFAVWAAVLVCVSGAAVLHHREIWQLKTDNANSLRKRESDIAQAVATCADPCIIEHADLDAGLRPDWVLPRDFWPAYLEWLRIKYVPEKQVRFTYVEPTGSGGA